MGWLAASLTIPSGAADSPELDLAATFPAAKVSITIIPPATLPETVTAQIAAAVGGNYAAIQKDGADLTVPVGKATPAVEIVAGALKLHAGGNVAADRTFDVLAAISR